MKEKLKPCPFCGTEAKILEEESGDNPKICFRVNCLNIDCSMGYPDAWYDNKSELIYDWNKREATNINEELFEALCNLRKFLDRLPDEWFPETLAEQSLGIIERISEEPWPDVVTRLNLKHDKVHMDLPEQRTGRLKFRKLIETEDLNSEIITIVNSNFWDLVEEEEN